MFTHDLSNASDRVLNVVWVDCVLDFWLGVGRGVFLNVLGHWTLDGYNAPSALELDSWKSMREPFFWDGLGRGSAEQNKCASC